MEFRIERARALVHGRLEDTSVHFGSEAGVITGIGLDTTAEGTIDASGLLVLPGIVDVHGDAFERQVMPRPRVAFPLDIALLESDRQAVSNGITTIFHGVTWSWEPGLRGAENARAILAGIERIRPRLGADTRYHLRHETYNLDAEPEIHEWLAGGRIDAIAFNDHMSGIVESAGRAHKLAPMIERSGLSREDFLAVVERTQRRASEVPASIERLAAAANAAGTPLLSHDDTSPQQRRWFRSLGCRLAEFPTTVETAEEAASQGDDIVLGAPNVVRGGSHTGWIDATKMIGRGLCSVLASDYYYPAPLLAAFALAARGVVPLEQAWMLVSRTPAHAVRLTDRGDIARGQRADLVIVDPSAPAPRRCHNHIRSRRASGASRYYRHIGQTQVGCCSRSRVMDEPRYAIYFVPPARSDLYRFGARFLGYDCYSGDDLGHPADIGLAAIAWEELTREPRRYGFHATLKAPFRLLPPFTEADLVAELDRFTALPRASVSVEPTIRPIERFIAIVPRGSSPAVDQLAANCVRVFDRFRGPLTPQERHRRVGAGASARQIENLDRWGYPFVFEDFRFHMTLTGAIDARRHGPIIALVQAAFERVEESRSLPITQLVLARQDAPAARFRVVREAKLAALHACG